jgi:hypothetical protein
MRVVSEAEFPPRAPAISTVPSRSRVAVCPERGPDIGVVALQVPLIESYNSAEDIPDKPPPPPTRRTWPLGKVVIVGLCPLATVVSPVRDHLSETGS